MKRLVVYLSTFIIILFLSIIITSNSHSYGYVLAPNNLLISYENIISDEGTYDISVSYLNNSSAYCSIDDINYKHISECNYTLPEGKHTIYIKNSMVKISKDFNIETSYDGTFNSSLDNVEEYYLALNGTKTINYNFNYPKDYNIERVYTIEDPSIISIEGDTITGLKVGTTKIHVRLLDGNSKTYTITVTDIIQPAVINNNKSYLTCKRYSLEEAKLLDKILESRIKEAGEGTRGAAVATARFLTLEFPYMIRYFNENGRLNGHGRPYIDGEGRYYHKGLYLSEDKYKSIVASSSDLGPQMWGCELYDKFIAKMNRNGFTCSGFISWVFLNAGLETGDVGAGDYPQFNDDLSDLGPHHEITEEYMIGGNYKVGDYIGRNGHAAIIIGIDENNIYTAEALPPKLKAYTYERYNGIVNDKNLTYIIEMTNIYPNGDGNYTDMW